MKRYNGRFLNLGRWLSQRMQSSRDHLSPTRMKERFRPKRLILSIAVPLVLGILYLLSPIKLGAALETKSVECQVFLYEKPPFTRPAAADDYVLFRFKEGDLSPEYEKVFKRMKLIKRVGCTAGSVLECQFGTCTCDGRTVVDAIAEKFSARAWTYSGVVPPGRVFLVGDYANSYDGRYWGLVPEENLVGRVTQCLVSRNPS